MRRWSEVARGCDGGIWTTRRASAFCLVMSFMSLQPQENWQALGLPFSLILLHSPFSSPMVHWVPAFLHSTPNFDIHFRQLNLHSCHSIKSTCGAINQIRSISGISPFSLSLPPFLPLLKNASYYLLVLQALSKFATPILHLSFWTSWVQNTFFSRSAWLIELWDVQWGFSFEVSPGKCTNNLQSLGT